METYYYGYQSVLIGRWSRYSCSTHIVALIVGLDDTIRYKMLFNVQSNADMGRLNLPHGTNN